MQIGRAKYDKYAKTAQTIGIYLEVLPLSILKRPRTINRYCMPSDQVNQRLRLGIIAAFKCLNKLLPRKRFAGAITLLHKEFRPCTYL